MKKHKHRGVSLAKKDTSEHIEDVHVAAPKKAEKSQVNWKYVRWAIGTLLCILFVGGLAGYSEYVKRHPPTPPAHVVAKLEKQCSFVSTYDVKDESGKIVSHRTQTQQGACVPKEVKPFEFPLWAKILFYTFVVVVCLCGGWEILIVFFI